MFCYSCRLASVTVSVLKLLHAYLKLSSSKWIFILIPFIWVQMHFCHQLSELITVSNHVFLVNVYIATKEEVVLKARPVSSDVGNSNPNFSDLMDEFIQERLRAKGTVVSPTQHTLSLLKCHKPSKLQIQLSSLCTGSPWQQSRKSWSSQRPARASRGWSEFCVTSSWWSSAYWWSRCSFWVDITCKCQRFWCPQLWQPVRLF